MTKYRIFAWSQVSLGVMLAACGGGGSVTEVGGLSVQFTAEQSSPPANSVSLQDGGVLDDLATVVVQAEDIALPAVRMTFTILFDQSVLEFADWEAGDFFEQQAMPKDVTYTVPSPAEGTGRLVVQIVKSSAPLSSLGDGVMLKLRFRGAAAGVSMLIFEGPELVGSTGTTAQNVSWFGGRLDVS